MDLEDGDPCDLTGVKRLFLVFLFFKVVFFKKVRKTSAVPGTYCTYPGTRTAQFYSCKSRWNSDLYQCSCANFYMSNFYMLKFLHVKIFTMSKI
jgi:hypothetical protein